MLLPLCGYSIVSIYGSDSNAFKYKEADYAAEILLPATLKRVENYAFQGCKIPITLPEENALESVGEASFQLSGFKGTLVLNDGCTLGSNAFGGSSVTTLVVKHKNKTGLPPVGALSQLTKLVLAGEGFIFTAKGMNDIYQDWPCVPASMSDRPDGVRRYERRLSDGSRALLFVNLGSQPTDVSEAVSGRVRDVLATRDLPPAPTLSFTLRPHASRVFRITAG